MTVETRMSSAVGERLQ